MVRITRLICVGVILCCLLAPASSAAGDAGNAGLPLRSCAGLHAPYNSGGDLYAFPAGGEEYLSFIDGQIAGLGEIAIVRNSGFTGLLAIQNTSTACQNGKPPCFLPEPYLGWDLVDGAVNHAAQMGMEIMIEVNLLDKVDGKPYTRDREDVDVMIALAEAALKRYDGDCDLNDNGNCTDHDVGGVDEAPGRPFGRVRCWQVSNEPGLNKWTLSEQVRVRGQDVLSLAYGTWQVSERVRSQCPDCYVALAGAGGYIRVDTWTQKLLHRYYGKLIDDIEWLGGDTVFDLFDFHYHNQEPLHYSVYFNLAGKYDAARRLLDDRGYSHIPIWVTETSSWTGSPKGEWWSGDPPIPYPNHSEMAQAGELIKRHVYPWSLGVERVFWSPILDFVDYADRRDGYFNMVGLLDSQGVQKRSYDALRLLLDRVGESETVVRIAMGDANVYLFRFDPPAAGGRQAYVLWKEQGMTHLDLASIIETPAGSYDVRVTTLGARVTGETLDDIAIATHPKFVEIVPR